MEKNVKLVGEVVVIELGGSVVGGPESTQINQDIYNLIEKGNKRFIIDLCNVNLMNSSGLGTLIASLTSVKKAGGELILASANEKIKNLFLVTKLNSIFEFKENVQDAVTSFNK